MNAIEVEGLTKDFRPGWRRPAMRALDDVGLGVGDGEVVGLLGPNGSGKSTLLKLALGLLAPTAGHCRLFGWPSHWREARRRVGYLPEAPDFYPHLSGFELVHFLARLDGAPPGNRRACVKAAIDRVGLADAMHRRVGTYSRGMRQRIGLAAIIAQEPRLIVLDEPVSGLDPIGLGIINRLIADWRVAGCTVLFSSHDTAQMETVCDRVAVLHGGRLLLEGTVEELTGQGASRTLVLDGLPAAVLTEVGRLCDAHGLHPRTVARPGTGLDQVLREALREVAAAGRG